MLGVLTFALGTAIAEAPPQIPPQESPPAPVVAPPELPVTEPVPAKASLPEAGTTESTVQAPAFDPIEEAVKLALRFDGSFFMGNGGVEGFALPSYRVTLFGKLSPHVRYRMSVGQAREFSSAFLPTLVPVEAFATFSAGDPQKPRVTVTAGLFSPSLVPWWTPDLSELPIPDYASIHRATLLSREMGAEVTLAAVPGYLEASAAVVNGTGIFGSQSGATRAITGMIRTGFGIPEVRVMLGVGGYQLAMGSSGTPQFRQQLVADVFLQLRFPHVGITMGADAILGKYEDAFRKLSPTGGEVYVLADVTSMFDAFVRYELLDEWWGDTPSFRRIDLGPIVKLAKGAKLFLLLTHRDTAGAAEAGGEARLRVQL